MSFAATVLAFLLTYAVQSTILLLLCWIGLSSLRGFRPEHRGLLWKAALLGSVATSALHSAGMAPGWGFEFNIADRVVHRTSDVSTTVEESIAVVPAEGSLGSLIQSQDGPLSVVWNLPTLIALGWLIVAVVGLLQLAAQYIAFRILRRSAIQVRDVQILAIKASVAKQVGVNTPIDLFQTNRNDGPLVLGFVRKRIFVASDFLECLDRGQLQALIAHELAHVAHRDAWWNLATEVIRRVFFFQPLNLFAIRQIRIEAEYAADRVTATVSSGLDLARCLESLTEWSRAKRLQTTPSLAVGIGSFQSLLGRRVARLLREETDAEARNGKRLAFCGVVAMAALATMLLMGPHLVAADARQAETGSRMNQQRRVVSESSTLFPEASVGFVGVVEGTVSKIDSADSFVLTVRSVEEYLPEHNTADDPVTLAGVAISVRISSAGAQYQPTCRALSEMESGKAVRITIRHQQGREFQLLGTFRPVLERPASGFQGFRGVIRARIDELDPSTGKMALVVQQVLSLFPRNAAQDPRDLQQQSVVVDRVSNALQRQFSSGDQIDIAVIHDRDRNFRFAGETLKRVEATSDDFH